MSKPVAVRRIIHTIHAVRDIDAARQLYLSVLGGLTFAEGYHEPEDRDMALLYVADHMIEPMAARDPARVDKPFARYIQRYGPGWHSFEIKVESAPAAAAAMRQAGCELAAVYDIFFFVRPQSTGGVLLEVCEIPMRNDPFDRPNWNPRWAEGLPSGLLRLAYIACVTPDLDAALGFFCGVLDGEVVSDRAAPQGRRAMVRLGDTLVSFVQPEGESGLADFLRRPNSGVYALVWKVEDEARAEDWLRAQGLRTTREGSYSGGFAIDPRDFHGARHEFIGDSATGERP